MSSRPDDNAGVTYRDVEMHMREIQSEHCCNLRFDVSTPVASGTAVLFWVGLTAEPRIVGRKTIRQSLKVSRRWPHVDHKTMAGAMLGLLYEIDAKLAVAGHVPAEQALLDLA